MGRAPLELVLLPGPGRGAAEGLLARLEAVLDGLEVVVHVLLPDHRPASARAEEARASLAMRRLTAGRILTLRERTPFADEEVSASRLWVCQDGSARPLPAGCTDPVLRLPPGSEAVSAEVIGVFAPSLRSATSRLLLALCKGLEPRVVLLGAPSSAALLEATRRRLEACGAQTLVHRRRNPQVEDLLNEADRPGLLFASADFPSANLEAACAASNIALLFPGPCCRNSPSAEEDRRGEDARSTTDSEWNSPRLPLAGLLPSSE